MSKEKPTVETVSLRLGLYACLLSGLIAGGLIVPAPVSAADTESVVSGDTAKAIEQLQKEGKYVCLLLYKEKNAKLTSFQNAAEVLKKNQAGKAEVVTADALAATSGSLLKKYKLDPAKMPMLFLMVNRALPSDTETVIYAKFRYQLAGDTKFKGLTVHLGKELAYERDGDSCVLEDWLRERKFIEFKFN